MGESVISFDDAKAGRYLQAALFSFLNDPPDSLFQCGYLAALLAVYQEGLGKGQTDDRVKTLDSLLSHTFKRLDDPL